MYNVEGDKTVSKREKNWQEVSALVFAHSKERLRKEMCVSEHVEQQSLQRQPRKKQQPALHAEKESGGSSSSADSTPPFTVIYYYALQLHCLINILTGNEGPGASLILQIFLPLSLSAPAARCVFVYYMRMCSFV